MRRVFWMGSLLLLAVGCPSKKEEPPGSVKTPPPLGEGKGEGSGEKGAAKGDTPVAPRAQSVGEKLALEASNRPAANPKAEAVLEALQKAGLHLKNQKQHAASPIGASYCIGAESDENVALSVCEYKDKEAAGAGREASIKAFQAIANREVFAKGTTTLTLLQAPKSPQSEAAAKRAVEVFEKL